MAFGLKRLLQHVIQAAEPWIAEDDINPGERWRSRLEELLDATTTGIVCVTPRSASAEWLHFEAGALSTRRGALVTPLCCRVQPEELPGALSSFKAVPALDEGAMLGLMLTLSRRLPPESQCPMEEVIASAFNAHFPAFRSSIVAAVDATAADEAPPEDRVLARLGSIDDRIAALQSSHDALASRLRTRGSRQLRVIGNGDAEPGEE